MDRNRVFRAIELTIGFLIILVSILGLMSTMYGMKYFRMMALDYAAVESVVIPVVQTGIAGLVASAVSLVVGTIPFIRKMSFGFIIRLPITIYKTLKGLRNWLLEKVEYLQSESAKWRTTFNILKSPYSLLRAMGLSPQMATSLLIGASTVGGGVVVNETILADKCFSCQTPGIYAAPLVSPIEWKDDYNTLRIDLSSTPVREITIKDVSLGTVFTGSALPSGQQNVVDIGGVPASSGFVATKLEVGHLIFEKSRCKKLELSNIQTHTLVIRGNASDGMSLAPSAGTSRMLAIGGGHHQADAMITSGGTYDRLWIQAPLSGINGKVDKLTLSNLYTKGGICKLSNINAGTVEILLNEIGDGTGFATKEFTIAGSVTAAHITIEDNVEVTIAEPATQ
jgi:hypothetical protein